MLTPADRDLVQREDALPGLAALLDPAAILERLRPHWPTNHLTTAEPFYLRYKPGTGCLAGYRLGGDGAAIVLTVHARRPDAVDKLSNHLEKRGTSGGREGARLVLPDALAVTVYPDDRRLPKLRRLLRDGGAEGLAADIGLAAPCGIEPLRYRPERRLVARLRDANGAHAAAKFYRRDDYAAAVANAEAFVASGELIVPRVRGRSDRYCAVVSTWVDGRPLTAGPAGLARAGTALALLHRQSPGRLRPIAAAAQGRALCDLAEYLAALWPPLGKQARRVASRLAAALVAAPGDAVAQHGDFHLDQLVDAGDAVGIVDFDEAGVGAAGWDAGNLIGHLIVGDLPTLANRAEDGQDALLDGYRRAGGRLSVDDLRLHTAQGVFRLAGRPFRERQPDWPERIEQILATAERLAHLSRRRVAASAPPDDLTALIDAACDRRRCADLLDLPALGPGAWRIEHARLLRHKPGRRALIEYDVVNTRGDRHALLGKIRARGADLRTFALHQDLRRVGFGDDADDGIRVPQAVSVVPGLSMWLQRKVAGRAFGSGGDRVLIDPARAAAAIAKLHRCAVRPVRRHTLHDELQILHERLGALADRRPGLRSRLERLREAADSLASTAVPTRPRPIHRDFYHDHLLGDEQSIHLIDLDLFCMGDPAVDLGNFGAHLIELGLRESGDADRFAGWQRMFERHYLRLTGGAGDNIGLYELLSLIRLIEIGDRIPERRSSNQQLLDYCDARVETAALSNRVAGAR